MPFPTVKSDPYKKRPAKRVGRFHLWSADFWGKLVKQSMRDWKKDGRPISPACIEMIVEMNKLLYGP